MCVVEHGVGWLGVMAGVVCGRQKGAGGLDNVGVWRLVVLCFNGPVVTEKERRSLTRADVEPI